MGPKKQIKLRSLIKQYIPDELFYELQLMTMHHELNNNEKFEMNYHILDKYKIPYQGLGTGTNRMGILIDGFVFKIALDIDGMIDNKREFKYTDKLQPYVVKVYECCTNGLIAVCEYVNIFDRSDLTKYRIQMERILSDVTERFLVGDVGITDKNYGNWGKRANGTICMLDFAYIYDVKYKLFVCSCDNETLLQYDENFVNLICPRCGRSFTFGDIRQRVTKKKQQEEIGDIRDDGYVISHDIEEVDEIPEFSPHNHPAKEKKEKSELEREIELYKQKKKDRNAEQDWDNPVQLLDNNEN